jgi:hypothetical protein
VRLGPVVHDQAEHVEPVVVADRVEQAPAGTVPVGPTITE